MSSSLKKGNCLAAWVRVIRRLGGFLGVVVAGVVGGGVAEGRFSFRLGVTPFKMVFNSFCSLVVTKSPLSSSSSAAEAAMRGNPRRR